MRRVLLKLRIGKFFDFLYPTHGQMALEDKARIFANVAHNDNIWAFNGILKFIQLLKDRADRKEITGGTNPQLCKKYQIILSNG